MGFNHLAAMFIPMGAKTFALNILKCLKVRARVPKGFETYCLNQYGCRVINEREKINQNASGRSLFETLPSPPLTEMPPMSLNCNGR